MSRAWWYSAHTHSVYSAKDALPSVKQVVGRAAELGYPALGLTDHGTVGGLVDHYTQCRKHGIEPLPGIEAYVALDDIAKRPTTFHMGILATTENGYRNLCALQTRSAYNFKYKHYLTIDDLATMPTDGLVCLSGCWFGWLPTVLRASPDNAVGVLQTLDSIFDRCYVEVQNHGIYDDEHDDDRHVEVLLKVAEAAGLPAIITQDSHYVSPEDRRSHDFMKRLVSWDAADPDSAIFPGDLGYHMLSQTEVMGIYEKDQLRLGKEGLDDLYARAQVQIPELDTFSMRVPPVGVPEPHRHLEKVCEEALQEYFEKSSLSLEEQKTYSLQLEEEFRVIAHGGFAEYLLFTAQVLEWMRDNNIKYYIRGSASGSLVCFLLEISQLDPLKWRLRFDRFLSTDRTKPPDIDIDVPHDERDDVLMWLDSRFATAQISTWRTLSISPDKHTGESKGSLLVRYRQYQRKIGQDATADIDTATWGRLEQLSMYHPMDGQGTHPAGVVVASAADTAQIPLARVGTGNAAHLVTAYEKNAIETLGLVKLDILGLRTLSALVTASELSGVSLDRIGQHDPAVFRRIKAGQTVGMFQLEGPAQRNGCKAIRPKTVTDLVAIQALYRPAVMNIGTTDAYVRRRQRKEPTPQLSPILAAATSDTYGLFIYQEQVLEVMRNIGMTVEEMNQVLKAVKASNKNIDDAAQVMENITARVRELCEASGVVEIDLVLDALKGYAEYGFNRAHATSYAVMAYMTGWFAVHRPKEFWTGMLLAYEGKDQEDTYIAEAERRGVHFASPHVNHSDVSYTPHPTRRAIRQGLKFVNGVGETAAKIIVDAAPFSSLDDMAARLPTKQVTGIRALGAGRDPIDCPGVIGALAAADALRGLKREKT